MKRFVIFGTGRSGSTLLASLLNSHPQIHCDGELLHGQRWSHGRRMLLEIFRRRPGLYLYYRAAGARIFRHTTVYGFKLHVYQAKTPAQTLGELERTGWRIVFLRRISVFDQAISACVAHATRRFHGREGNDPPQTEAITLDPDSFLRTYHKLVVMAQDCRVVVSTVPHLTIIYEDDLAAPQTWDSTTRRICEYLDIAPSPAAAATHLRKPWQQPYSELVTNFAELKALAESQ